VILFFLERGAAIETHNAARLDRMEAPYRRRIIHSYLARIRAWLKELDGDPALLDDETAALPEDYASLENIHELFMRSCLMGMDTAGAEKKKRGKDFADPLLLPDAPIGVLPFEEAVSFLGTQIPLDKKAYYDLDDRLRLRAFTVGRLNDCDAINNVKGVLRKGLEEGGTIADFYRMTDAEILNGAGFGKGNMSYWETVYRTNIDAVHNAGRAMGFEASPPIALELVGINDSRQSEICQALTNPPFIRPYGDPVWQNLWPPFHFSCRTYVRGIYDPAELDEYGGPEQAYAMGNYAAPAKGFGRYPLDKESYWRLTPDMVERAKGYGIDGEIAAAASKLGMPQYAMELVKNYKTVYPEGGGLLSNGGYVKQSELAKPGINNSFEKGHWIETDELGLAKKAADDGHEIFFLPKSKAQGIKSPDIIIDGQVADIKHVFTETPRAVNEAVKSAKKQGATFVLMQAPDGLTWETIEDEVKDRMGSQIKNALVSWRGVLKTLKK
jgi:hypothetical protein